MRYTHKLSPQTMTEPFPATDLLYLTYEGNWIQECEARVLAIQDEAIILDRTVLHAQGGGQPTDVGTITASQATFQVQKVTLDRSMGVAMHQGEGTLPRVGATVRVQVDADLRQQLSECHTAGHVVDSCMSKIGLNFKPTKGYHFLDGPYVEYKGTIPVDEREKVVKDLQSAFSQLVDQDIETCIESMTIEQADEVCNRVAHNFDVDVFADSAGRIRVVTVAGYPCPCGGTHVRSTGQLKGWNVTGLRVKKGVVRVRYGQNVQVKGK